jgi:signal transduction histidine kinase
MVQEALRNIANSGVARASATGGGLMLTVEDQGRGFDPAAIGGKRGLGLVSMKERVAAAGGLLKIKCAARRGHESSG